MKSGLDKASIQRDRDCASAIIRSELRENALHMPFDRSLGNREPFSDEFVCISRSNASQHIDLTIGEPIVGQVFGFRRQDVYLSMRCGRAF
jgi:hypothetical protein